MTDFIKLEHSDFIAVWQRNRDFFTQGEIRLLAKSVDWEKWVIHTEYQLVVIGRESLLGLTDPDRLERDWLIENEGCIETMWMTDRGRVVVEIYKQVDDWYWVVFYETRAPAQIKYAADALRFDEGGTEYYRCDQMAGLLSLLRWAMPAHVTGGGGKTNQQK